MYKTFFLYFLCKLFCSSISSLQVFYKVRGNRPDSYRDEFSLGICLFLKIHVGLLKNHAFVFSHRIAKDFYTFPAFLFTDLKIVV